MKVHRPERTRLRGAKAKIVRRPLITEEEEARPPIRACRATLVNLPTRPLFPLRLNVSDSRLPRVAEYTYKHARSCTAVLFAVARGDRRGVSAHQEN